MTGQGDAAGAADEAPPPDPVDGAAAGLLAALHRAAFPPADAWGPDAFRLMLEQPGTFGLRVAGLGFILARAIAGEAEILTLAVLPAARRRGIGELLLAHAMAQACRRGASAMFLEVAAGNAAARALYLKAGFGLVGQRPRYYPDGGDALVLRREFG